MRSLLYIPIIHEEADLGSAGPALAQSGSSLAGGRRWDLHKQTVRGFWDEVERCLRRFDPRNIRVYQDGLAADGALGRRIAEEASRRGSRNYQIILALLDSGADLRATEDPELLLLEGTRLHGHHGTSTSAVPHQELLERRDAYIARKINSTLREGELGVLFVGAGHAVIAALAEDIAVRRFKDPEKLLLYLRELLLGQGDQERLEALAMYVQRPADEGEGESGNRAHPSESRRSD